MYEKITEKEIEFMEHFYDPVSLKECLFPENIKSCHTWDEPDVKMYQVRPYQYAWQNYSLMYADDDELSARENFQRKKGAGICYNIGARNTGKSHDFIMTDVPIAIMHLEGKESALASCTDKKLKKIANPVLNIFRDQPFFEIYHKRGKGSGIRAGNDISIETAHGHLCLGINEKINEPEPGEQFHGPHYVILWYEESSYQTEKGLEKRVDSGSSVGVIERFSGIPDLRVGSPLGDLLYNPDNKKYICRLPQYVREDWDEEQERLMEQKYKGKSSLAYKLNVEGEIIEGAEGFWDMERLRKKCLNKQIKIKNFDIGKDKFKRYKDILVVDRMPCEQIYISADIGAGARPTEIVIIFYGDNKYKYRYNISLNKLTTKEQAEIFSYLYNILGSAFIALDATTDYGIAESLYKDFNVPQEHILSIDLRKKLEIDFERDNEGRIKLEKGKPVTKEMIAIDFAMQELEDLFYEGLMDIPIDQKFFKEFSSFIVKQTGLNRKYGSSSSDDLHQAFQIFAINRAKNRFESLKNKKRERPPLGYI